MKKIYTFLVAVLFFGNIKAAPFQKLPYIIKQPNGTIIECFMSGDEFFNWIHDNDGYPIIKGSDNYYYYSIVLNHAFVASQYIVGEHQPAYVGIVKMQDIDKNLINKISKQNRNSLKIPAKPNLNSTRDTRNTLHTGTFNNLVIYIRFAGENDIQTPRKVYDDRLNPTTGYTLKSYYWETSYNQLTINSTHYPPVDNPETQNFSYQDTHTRNYFEPYDATSNPAGYNGFDERASREQQLLADAVAWINANHPVPTGLNIDADEDGYVDNICFMINGNCGQWNDLLWAHRWALYMQYVTINGKRVWDFTFQPENQVSVRTLCHEMFHVLGAPDLYHYYVGTDLHPAGQWDIMEYGQGHMLTYMKWKYAQQNWITHIPEITEAGQYTLFPSTQQTNSCYRIASPNSNNQFFMVEYRTFSGEFESLLPDQGIIVYRINTDFDGNADYDGITEFDEIYVYRQDGTTTLNGDHDIAAYSSNNGRTAINDNTQPSSFLFDGTQGGLNIYNVSQIGDSISFNVSFEANPTVEVEIIPIPAEGGNPSGAGSYAINSQVELQANPNQGWNFIAWATSADVLISTAPFYNYVLGTENIVLKAVYQQETSIENNIIKNLIYPNPSNDILNIETLNEIKQISILDINGQMVKFIESTNTNMQIDISDLSAGIYLIKILDKDLIKSYNRFIKR